ncbi:MAG TPA: hypothetical protein VNI83_09285 [Vicinamibacterales bacterium]|nr:hypothetical protein [Vicinamibacterales bacterium]
MVGGLQDADAGRSDRRGERALDLRADVTGKQDRDVAVTDVQHDRVVVPHALALPVGYGRVEHGDLRRTVREAITRPDPAPRAAGAGDLGAKACQIGVRRHRHALPHLARPEGAHDAGGAAEVIRIAVRDHEHIEPARAERQDRRHDDPLADVERGARQAARVDEHRAPARQPQQHGVALTDIEEGRAQLGRAQGREDGGDPDRRQHRRAGEDGRDRGAPRRCRSTDRSRPAAGEPQRQRGVVQSQQQEARCRDAPGEPGPRLDETRRLDQPVGGQPRDDAGGGGGARHERYRHRDEAGGLREGHQRDRGEVQREAGDGDAVEQQRAERRERQLGRQRSGEQRANGRPGPRERPPNRIQKRGPRVGIRSGEVLA